MQDKRQFTNILRGKEGGDVVIGSVGNPKFLRRNLLEAARFTYFVPFSCLPQSVPILLATFETAPYAFVVVVSGRGTF